MITEVTCFDQPAGWCHASGDPHYITYDGSRYDFMGTCRYLFSGVTTGNATAHLPRFDVQVQHRQAWNTQVAMTEHVWFTFDGLEEDVSYTVYIRVGDPPQGSGRPSFLITDVTINEHGNVTTINANEMRNDDFTLVNHGHFIQVTNWFNVEVEFTASSWAIDVHTPPCYEGHLEGLCGNWNGEGGDDFTGSDGEIHSAVDFAQSWQTSWDGEDCEAGPEVFPECTDQAVIDGCSLMTDTNGVFADCFNTDMPTETFEENCVFDYCLDANLRCPILSQYAQMCFRALQGTVDNSTAICNWAEETGCAPPCGDHSHYTGCADLCRDTRTCGNRDDDFSHCSDSPRFISMCVCDEGFLLEDGKCIPETECGCNTHNGASVANGFVYDGCDGHCECTNGNYECTVHTECRSGCGFSCECVECEETFEDGDMSDNCEQHCECHDGIYECTPHPEGKEIEGCAAATDATPSVHHTTPEITDVPDRVIEQF